MEVEANKPMPEGKTSVLKSIFNGLNAIIGVGILSIPYALASGGWLSLILLIIISGAACYAGLLTTRSMEADPSIQTYSDIGEHAFGKWGKRIVSIVLYIDLYLVLTGYLILEGDNLHNLFPGTKVEPFGFSIQGKTLFVIIIAFALLPTVWLDDLSLFAYISATGVIACLIILISVWCVGAFDGVGFHNKGQLIKWKGIPTAMSLYMFSYSANPVFPSLYTSMQKKRHFPKVLLIGFLGATICYTSMAVIGYLMFGKSLNSQITLNLPTHRLASKIAIYTAWIAPLSKYALMMDPVAATTEDWFPKYRKKRWFRMVVRTTLVASQVVVALSIPFFGSLMSLVGALLSATASITIPCLCYLKITKPRRRSVEWVVIVAIIVASLVIVVVGTYTSMVDVIRETSKHHHHR